MQFMEWMLHQRQHPHIGAFATWAWSQHSNIPRTASRLQKVLMHCPPEWREPCKRAHSYFRAEREFKARRA